MRELIVVRATAAQGTSKSIKDLLKSYTEKGETPPGVLSEEDFLKQMGVKGF